MSRKIRRTPRGYDGTGVTTHHFSDVLSSVLEAIGDVYNERPDLVMAAWPEIIGPKLATMTQVVSFQEGVLTVKVKNSTLHSLLSQHDRLRILTHLRQKFPKVNINSIVFRIG